MENVLITGGAGFIGFHLAKSLQKHGLSVDIADNFSRGVKDGELLSFIEESGCSVYDIDLCDNSQIQINKQYDYIFHLAAVVGVKNVVNAPFGVLKTNITSLMNMLDFAANNKELKRFVFSSTSEAYAGTLEAYGMEIPTPENTPLTICDPADKRTAYMLSKITGEALCAHSGFPYTAVRFHNIYGPRMGLSHVVPELLKKAHALDEGEKLPVFSPWHTRAFCYVDDAVKMLRDIIKSDRFINDVFNIGNESAEISIKELAETIIKISGKQNTLNLSENTSGSPERRAPKMGKFERFQGKTEMTPLKDGIKSTYEWYKKNIFENDGVSAV